MLKRRAALKAEAMRRTTSYVNFRISEESDEDDCDNPDITKDLGQLQDGKIIFSLLLLFHDFLNFFKFFTII